MGLPEWFSQLSMGSIAQSPSTGPPGGILAQPTFIFLGQGATAAPSGASASFHSAQSGSHYSLICQGRFTGVTALAGIGAALQQDPLNQPSLVLQGPPLGLPRPNTLSQQPVLLTRSPRGWTFYPGYRWAQYQWIPAPVLPGVGSTVGASHCSSTI